MEDVSEKRLMQLAEAQGKDVVRKLKGTQWEITDEALFCELYPMNISYHAEHGITNADLATVKALREKIEERTRLCIFRPMPGDKVRIYGKKYTTPLGMGHKIYENARVDVPFDPDTVNGKVMVCIQPYNNPHITPEMVTCQSGGPFKSFENHKVVYVGTGPIGFWTWGHMGPRGNGGITFKADVNYWEVYDEGVY